MRRPRTDAQPPTPPLLSRTPPRTTRGPTVLAWLALGMGLLGLLSLLTAELVPAIQALVRFPTSAVLASDQQWAPREEEPFGLVPFTVDDYFARL